MSVLVSHTRGQIITSWVVALLFAVFLFLMFYWWPQSEEEEEEGGSETQVDAERGDHQESAPEQRGLSWEEVKNRVWMITTLAWSMGFAWCCFYSGRMSLAQVPRLQDPMILAIVLTLVISLVSFGIIRILDIIDDDQSTGQNSKNAIHQIIRAIALLVGFGWEQAFDQAVESISSVLSWPHLAKFLLAIFCIFVVVPAWYEYILPMAITKNWEWGFLVKDFDDPTEEERWLKVVEHIKEKRARKDGGGGDSVRNRVDTEASGYSSQLTVGLEDVMTSLRSTRNKSEEAVAAPYVQLAGDENKVVQELRKQNQRLRDALTESVEALRTREQAEQQRAQDLRVDIGQMDAMLSRMRKVEEMVAASVPVSAKH